MMVTFHFHTILRAVTIEATIMNTYDKTVKSLLPVSPTAEPAQQPLANKSKQEESANRF